SGTGWDIAWSIHQRQWQGRSLTGDLEMSIASHDPIVASPWIKGRDIWRCTRCRGALNYDAAPALACAGWGLRFAIEDDILIVTEQTSANNRVAQGFYDSPLWPKFRFWEKFTWLCNGGERRAREHVLKHLPQAPGIDLLDVAIGDGVYLDWLPADWRIV